MTKNNSEKQKNEKQSKAAAAPKADVKPAAESPQGRDLFIVVVPASTPDGPITRGEIAESGAEILKSYPALFRPLAIKYRA